MPDLYSASLLALHIVYIYRMTLFVVIFVLESLKLDYFFKESTEKAVVFIDLTFHLPGRNHKSSHIRAIKMHSLTSSPHTLSNTANNGIKQITKERLSNFTNDVQTIFLKEIFLLTIFLVDFLYADNLFYQDGKNNEKK